MLFRSTAGICADDKSHSVIVHVLVARIVNDAMPSANTRPSVPPRVGRKLSNVSVRPSKRPKRLYETALTGYACKARMMLYHV